VGRKTYPNGNVYVGELSEDEESGRGVMTDPSGGRVVGTWAKGRLVEELVEMIVGAAEVDTAGSAKKTGGFVKSREPDAQERALEHRVFVAAREPGEPPQEIATPDGEGQSIVLFANGDKYLGSVKDGKRSGQGMYVYADGASYRGTWEADALDGEVHPKACSEEARKLHDLNERNADAAAQLKDRLSRGEKKQLPHVFRPERESA